jgi:6-pyruvoyltetrahydropterin/6-carboxytetrahydropterin synthase
MPVLSRTVRFSINPASAPQGSSPSDRDPNGYAGSPSMRGLGRHYEVIVRCAGEPDPATGYLIDIKAIDRAVRQAVVPLIQDACVTRPTIDPLLLMPALTAALAAALPGAQSMRWFLSPYYSLEMATAHAQAPSTLPVALLRQRFDFSASHRLHVPSMSDEENRRAFGKCNHPSGHGHNYQFEPCVAVPVKDDGTTSLTLQSLERLADRLIIQRFDHRYLNNDTEEFRTGARGGLNPTVENIARVCYDLLAPAIAREAPGATLRSLTVWETDRTSCTYPA